MIRECELSNWPGRWGTLGGKWANAFRQRGPRSRASRARGRHCSNKVLQNAKMQMARATRTEKFKFVPECLQLKWKRYPEVPQLTLKAIQKASPRVPNQAQRTPKKDPRKGAPKLGRKRGCTSHVTRGRKALKRYKFQGFFNSGTWAGTHGSGVYRHPFWSPFLGSRGVPA